MKPISSVSATVASASQSKPYLPPKPIKESYRRSSPAAPSSAVAPTLLSSDSGHHPLIPIKPRDQFNEEQLFFPRSHIDQGPPRPLPSPRHPTDTKGDARRTPSSPPKSNRASTPTRQTAGAGAGRTQLRSSDCGRQLDHSRQSWGLERMKVESVSHSEDSSGLTPIPSNLCPNSGTIFLNAHTDDSSSHRTTELLSVTSPLKPNRTSSSSSTAKQPAIVNTSSTKDVTTKPPVTSSDVSGSDVIYDEPSTVDLEWKKSLERMVMSDGYVKLRSDVSAEMMMMMGDCSGRESESVSRVGGKTNHHHHHHHPTDLALTRAGGVLRPSRSSESVDRLEELLDFSSYGGGGCGGSSSGGGGKGVRSSFVDPNGPPTTRRSVYIELGEYQTLLKHSRNDEECLYSLPQPLCYSEDTLRAVKLITDKYDTFKRRQLRALSFRDGTSTALTNRKSPLDPVEPSGPETTTESNNNKSNGGSSVQGVSAPVEPEKTGAKGGVESVRVCDHVVTRSEKQSGSLLLRDYCNTLEAGVGGATSGGLSKLNLMRVELFYRSREASVFVCRCLADLFVGTSIGEDSCPLFVHQHTGVPLWVLNSGEAVRGRELLLVVAERETGFPLWQDKINYLSNYVDVSPGVHSLRVSGSLRKTVRLDMFCEKAAAEFLARFKEITSDPNDDLWKISSQDATKKKKKSSSGQRKKKKKKTTKKKRSRLSKDSISQPCNFVHISRVDPTDANFRAAFSDLIPLRSSKCPTADPTRGPTSDSTRDSEKAFDDSKDPVDKAKDSDEALDSVSVSVVDPSKAFDSVDSAQRNNFESTAVDSSSAACEFRPRLPTR